MLISLAAKAMRWLAVLTVRLDTPDGALRTWALFAHCFTCSKDTKAAASIARARADAGFGVLRFDFTGLGGSGGDFGNTHFSPNVDDLVVAAYWMRAHHVLRWMALITCSRARPMRGTRPL